MVKSYCESQKLLYMSTIIITLNETIMSMAKDEYKELMACIADGGDTAQACGFQVRAKTEAEVMEHVKVHAKEAHGMEEISPEYEKKVKSNIKSVIVDEQKM
jgi:predicted small metal-binding protein